MNNSPIKLRDIGISHKKRIDLTPKYQNWNSAFHSWWIFRNIMCELIYYLMSYPYIKPFHVVSKCMSPDFGGQK